VEEIIRLQNFTKKFRKTTIFSNVNLTIYKGQSISFIGNNGVGKSTMLKVLARLSTPTSGSVHYAADFLVHYVPEHFPRTKLTVMQYLKLMGRIDNLSNEEGEAKIKTLLKDFFMEKMAHTPLKHLSKGTLQKVGVIQALLITPDILLLDEPLSGQDIDSQRIFVEKMKELLSKKVTLIMSCHEKYLIEQLSDTVFEVSNNGIQPIGSKGLSLVDKYCLVFISEGGDTVLPDIKCEMEQLGNTVKLYVDSQKTNEIIQLMMNQNWTLRGMYSEKRN